MRQDENEGNKEGAKRGSHHLCSSLSPLCKVERGEMEMERGVSQVGPSPLPLLISPNDGKKGRGGGRYRRESERETSRAGHSPLLFSQSDRWGRKRTTQTRSREEPSWALPLPSVKKGERKGHREKPSWTLTSVSFSLSLPQWRGTE